MNPKRKYKNIQLVLTALILVMTFFIKEGRADTSAIEKRLEALEQEVAILKRQLELEKEENAKKKSETPIISASTKDGFSIKSPDDNFKLKIRGLLQTDARIFTDERKDIGTTDTFTVRRARPIFDGTVWHDFDFYVVPDFGAGSSQLVDGFIEYKYFPKAKLKAGKFKTPLGLERLQSDAVANFIESGLPSNLVPNRDIGIQLSGDILNETTNYAVAIVNGGVDGASVSDSDNNNDKDVVGRIFTHPFKNTDQDLLKGFGIGMAGSYGHKEGTSLPTYRSAGQASIFSYASGVSSDGPHVRLAPQLYYYRNSFGVLGEYVASEQKLVRTSGGVIRDKFKNKSWQVSGTYVLTGEFAGYKGVTPSKPFDLKQGQWGAFELAGRFEHLDIDDSVFDNGFANSSTSVSEANAWGVGLNWYLNRNLKWALDFEQTRFESGQTSSDRPTENTIFSRFQIAY